MQWNRAVIDVPRGKAVACRRLLLRAVVGAFVLLGGVGMTFGVRQLKPGRPFGRIVNALARYGEARSDAAPSARPRYAGARMFCSFPLRPMVVSKRPIFAAAKLTAPTP